MTNFGENFRAGRQTVMCMLCNQHIDSQSYIFECPVVRNNLEDKYGGLSNSFDEIFHEDICKDLVQLLKAAMDIRNEKLKVT